MLERGMVWNRICGIRHPFLTVLLVGILARALIGSLAIVYDAERNLVAK